MLYTLNTQKLLYLKKKKLLQEYHQWPKDEYKCLPLSGKQKKKIDFKYNLLKPKTEV